MLIRTKGFNDFFRIGNWQLVAYCRFELWFLNRQLEQKSVMLGRVGLGRVGFG